MDRRKFLKTSAFASIAAGCSPIHVGGSHKGNLSLKFYPYELQNTHTFTVATYSRTCTPDVQVEIHYDGIVGYGEASMPQYLGHTVESVCNFLEKVNLEQFDDPFLIEDIMDYVDSLSDGDSPAKAAIDIALHDLYGKLLEQPLYRIWGINPEKAGSTSYTIGIDKPDVVRERAKEVAAKYNVLKIKVGVEGDREMIKAIRSVTGLPIVVDANQGWKNKEEALDTICWLSEQGVQMVEQPMNKENLDDIAWITERSPIPIVADESIQGLEDIKKIEGAFSGVNIKLMKCGGLRQARRMITYARARQMKVMLGCMVETSCAVTAAAHLAPLADFCDLDGNLLIKNDLFEGMTVKNGIITLPQRPGLGLITK